MIKVSLSISLLAISFSFAAKGQGIDLSKDAIYYCSDTTSVGVEAGVSSKFDPLKFTLKVKGDTLEVGEPIVLSSKDKGDFTIHKKAIFAAGLNGIFIAKVRGDSLVYALATTSVMTKDELSLAAYASTGTCTKW